MGPCLEKKQVPSLRHGILVQSGVSVVDGKLSVMKVVSNLRVTPVGVLIVEISISVVGAVVLEKSVSESVVNVEISSVAITVEGLDTLGVKDFIVPGNEVGFIIPGCFVDVLPFGVIVVVTRLTSSLNVKFLC